MKAARVVVVGGGISGLTVAFTLQEDARRLGAPLSLTVVEAAPRTGGHIHSTHADGFLIESGPNGFLNREPHTLTLVDALGLQSRLVEARVESRRRHIVRGGRLCAVPDGPVSLLTSPALSWFGKLRLLGEPFARAAPSNHEETVFDFASRRIGSEAAEMLVDAAVAGISAGDSRQLSVDAQFPKMVEMEREHGSLLRAMFARPRPSAPTRLVSFDTGMGALVDALTARLGSTVQVDRPVEALRRTGDGWRLTCRGGVALEADHVVLTVPAWAAAAMLRDTAPDLAASVGQVTYAGLTVVALGYATSDIPRALDGYGYLVTKPEALATLGVAWESSLFQGRAAPGTALLRVFLGGTRRPEMATAPPEQAVNTARQELAHVMRITAEPRHVSVIAWPQAIAQYTVGHGARRQEVRASLGRYPGLHISGTSFDGVSLNDAVKHGRLTARRLAEILWSRPSPTPAVEPSEAMVDA
jgi:oxygen-dependent protoporphyrinogen oxidase